MTCFTASMYAEDLNRRVNTDPARYNANDYVPLFAFDSPALDAPGSAELQYNVLVYGCTQKNRLCRFSPCPFPIALRVYLYKNSPIIVCVIAWMTAGSVDEPSTLDGV